MGVYVYCVGPAGLAPDGGLAGIDGAPVRADRVDDLAVWVSDLESPPAPSVERIRRHHEVVAAAMAAGATPVPARFGQWLDTEERLRRDVRRRLPELDAALRRVAGAVEFGVRLLDTGASDSSRPDRPEEVGDAPGPGRPPERRAARAPARPRDRRDARAAPGTQGAGAAYLRSAARRFAAARSEQDRARRVLASFREVLGDAVRADRVEAAPRDGGGASIALLVEAEVVERFGAAAEAVRRRFPDARLAVTGPWPPYSFGA